MFTNILKLIFYYFLLCLYYFMNYLLICFHFMRLIMSSQGIIHHNEGKLDNTFDSGCLAF